MSAGHSHDHLSEHGRGDSNYGHRSPASRGNALGRARVREPHALEVAEARIAPHEVDAELARLQAGETIENLTRLPGGESARHVVSVAPGGPSLSVNRDGWTFVLPGALLEPYVARLPCRDGLLVRLPVAGGIELEVDFEVDVRDSVRSRGTGKRGAQSPAEPDRESG